MEVYFTTQQLLNTSRLIRILVPCIKLNASLKIYLVSDKSSSFVGNKSQSRGVIKIDGELSKVGC